MWVSSQCKLINYQLTTLNFFKLKLSVCICTHSALIKLKKNYYLKNLLLLHLWIMMTYSFDFFLKNIEVNDLIMKKKKKKKKKKMNILSYVKF